MPEPDNDRLIFVLLILWVLGAMAVCGPSGWTDAPPAGGAR